MDFHLERKLRLNTSPKHGNLYPWGIVETDDAGEPIGDDYIPWGWTLYFKAVEFSYVESFRIDAREYGRPDRPPEIGASSLIRAELMPGHLREGENCSREPIYRMFGTDRVISEFFLDIIPTKEDEPETCTAWGSTSYTTEMDFRNETFGDTISFYLMLRPERFNRYVRNIAFGLVDDIVLRIGSVEGFYSRWTPAITTEEVKVLTAGDEHVVDAPEGREFPRLGKVSQVELTMVASRKGKTALAAE